MKIPIIALALLMLTLTACSQKQNPADAYGNFEADETIVSALMPGQLIAFDVTEGATLTAGLQVGLVDTLGLHLRKLEVRANQEATASQAKNVLAELVVLKDQLANLTRERTRARNLIKAGAFTRQQLDDIEGNINVIKSRMKSVSSQNATIDKQVAALAVKVRQIDEDINKSRIINPVQGVVLVKLAEPNEFVGRGRALYKVADNSRLYLRAFVSGSQLSAVELGQTYDVKIDGPGGNLLTYPGTITWIASEAEFTPKTIQTREQRQNLVYAVKVRVTNDGKIKIGMPGELWLTSTKP